jgi:hypothetical protein
VTAQGEASAPGSARTTGDSTGAAAPPPPSGGGGGRGDARLDDAFFNQGYYSRFFREERKLGQGLRGAVYAVRHVMHSVELGRYAVKKVPVGTSPAQVSLWARLRRSGTGGLMWRGGGAGDDRPWLLRMLQEVHTMEAHQHRNIVDYKHAWIENHRITPFGLQASQREKGERERETLLFASLSFGFSGWAYGS